MISFDYFFITSDGMHNRKEWDKIEDRESKAHLKILVVYDGMHKNISAHGVEQ